MIVIIVALAAIAIGVGLGYSFKRRAASDQRQLAAVAERFAVEESIAESRANADAEKKPSASSRQPRKAPASCG
jgi:hypothetical protein